MSMCRPSPGCSVTEPPTMRPGFWIKRRIEYAVTLLPQPDSPTTASVPPRFRLKLAPSTARSSPSSVLNTVRRSFTSSSRSLVGLAAIGIRRVAQPVAEEVEAQHHGDDEAAGHEQ